ncbi:MAG: DUF934 domain-containing protein [Hyphomicrobiales bacterium]|nr:DUF934 domain-containing protein [Hyphomicrobiales bacterium]
MKLLDRNGFRTDDFSRAGADGAARLDAVIVPFADLPSTAARAGKRLGVDIPNTVTVEQLAPHFEKLALIGIAFPASTDGRGFSLGRRLRRAGFKGLLRASGPLIPDQFPYALACGFDEIELPDASAARQPESQWLQALGAITLPYQRGYARPSSIFEQRRQARKEAAHG